MMEYEAVSRDEPSVGRVTKVSGPVVGASGLEKVRLFDVVQVGEMKLVGEVIRLTEDFATIQVYEDTSGIRVGEPVYGLNMPLVAHLGPGLLGSVYDGLQRPLETFAKKEGSFILRGSTAAPLDLQARWEFTPCVAEGALVVAGDVLGWVQESQAIQHRILVPSAKEDATFDTGFAGEQANYRVLQIREGAFTIEEPVATLEVVDESAHQILQLTMTQRWPVRKPRPSTLRLNLNEPLLTGTRVIDTFFPVAKGGSAIIPGGFGTGKTVVEHSLARWADSDVVVYVGCGERGNEMAEVLEEFPQLEDPHTGRPLMERTVLIANTSNMPVAAREASIYTGITIAEYYRDMGLDVLVLADSTSRWGEALREISGRLEEMPGEEGYPAYLAARLAEFYERSGRVVCLGDEGRRVGSVTIVGAVSPQGGDFSEPITQNSMRVVGTFWALDYDLSRRRHFPAINWTRSYSLYDCREKYSTTVAMDWPDLTREAMALLQREVELLEIVQLVGPDALAETERAELAIARILREDFLQQSAYHEIDRYCPVEKAYWMLKVIMDFYARSQQALAAGIPLEKIVALPVVAEIARIKELPPGDQPGQAQNRIQALMDRIRFSFAEWGVN